jgi:hypothetical protein
MPELNPLWIAVEHEDGQTKFEYQAGVYVTKDGQFHVDLDERLAEIAEKMDGERHTAGVCLALGRGSKKHKVHGKVLGYIATFIRDCAKDYLACEKITERVIVYGHDLKVAVWVDGDGKLYPNGCHDEGGQRKGGWFKGSDLCSSRTAPYYTVGLCAAVYDKTTYKRKSGSTVSYDRVRDTPDVDDEEGKRFKQPDEIIIKLNSFCGLQTNPERTDYKQMPYTVEAANFFYKMLLSMCRLAVEMDNFFGSPEKLTNAIREDRLLNAPPEPSRSKKP